MTPLQATRALHAQGAQLFEAVFQQAPDAMVVVDSAGQVMRVNARAERLFGLEEMELRGLPLAELLPPRGRREPSPGAPASSGHSGRWTGTWSASARRVDGSRVSVTVSSSMVAAASESLCVAVVRETATGAPGADVSLGGVFHDPMTGLPNRDLFLDRLSRAVRRSRRRADYLFGVLLLDVDRFKVVNGSLGHAAGDDLLRAIARRLDNGVRAVDTIARLGGDEFAVLLDDVRNAGEVIKVADRVLADISMPFRVDGHEVYATASIGIALSATGYDNPLDILRDADTAMYRAKALGKARHEMFDSAMHDRAMSRLRIELELRQAIERQEFRLHYQPIVDAQTTRVVGLEALVRWQHPERGMVSPAEFIPVAEETGLIVPIGEWVLRTACERVMGWHRAGFPDLRIAVNCSARQFEQTAFEEIVGGVLATTGLAGKSLELEITEGVLMHDLDACRSTLNALRARDVRIAIDDFGTGYSALGYLKSLPISTLKVDQSFVGESTTDPSAAAIVDTVIRLAHSLKLSVIAEGVEQDDQLEFLRAHDCDEIQGHLISRPVPEDAVAGLLERL